MKAIYGILNKINGHQYVGSAKNFYDRKRRHLQQLAKGDHHSAYLQRAWDKYGEENFLFIILEHLRENRELLTREQWWIDNSHSEYNVCKTAGSNLGRVFDEKARANMSKAHLGEKHPEWRRKQKSEYTSGDKHWTKKRGYTEEAKKNMSEAQKKLHTSGYKHPCRRAIIQLNDEGQVINQWDSLKETGKFFDLHPDTLSKYIRGKTNPRFKINLKYKDE